MQKSLNFEFPGANGVSQVWKLEPLCQNTSNDGVTTYFQGRALGKEYLVINGDDYC